MKHVPELWKVNPDLIARFGKLTIDQLERAARHYEESAACVRAEIIERTKTTKRKASKKIPIAWKMPKHVNRWN